MSRSGTEIKARIAGLKPPTFESTAFTRPPPLAEATVAILTSASLHHPEQPDFDPADISFRILAADRTDYVMGHWSQDVDHVGFALDHNVMFPIDRLHEMAADGRIGAVSDVHLAYAGNQFDVAGIRMDSGPEGAKILLDAGVDVVLLTPV